MHVLAAENLAVARGGRTLLRGLDFALNPGEALHLRGGNGIGKTSLLEVLSGLRAPADGGFSARPEAGQIHWLGHKNALNLTLTPVENLEFWCGLNGLAAAGTQPVLERLGIARLRHRPCRTLSAGQKRRCALARLLLVRRPLWLLDEPLDGLDAQGLALFAELLREQLADGGAAIVTSHQSLPPGVPGVRNWQIA